MVERVIKIRKPRNIDPYDIGYQDGYINGFRKGEQANEEKVLLMKDMVEEMQREIDHLKRIQTIKDRKKKRSESQSTPREIAKEIDW